MGHGGVLRGSTVFVEWDAGRNRQSRDREGAPRGRVDGLDMWMRPDVFDNGEASHGQPGVRASVGFRGRGGPGCPWHPAFMKPNVFGKSECLRETGCVCVTQGAS